MANHSRAFDKTDPPDTDDFKEGADKIQDFKEDVEERMKLDHWWTNSVTDGAADQDGTHQKVTMKERADPTAIADAGIVYTKDDGGDTELFYIDDSSNVVQITEDGALVGGTVYGYMTDGTTLYAKEINITLGIGVTSNAGAHGIANAMTNDLIKEVEARAILGASYYHSKGQSASDYEVHYMSWDDTNLTIYRGTSTAAYTFKCFIVYK